MGYLEDRRNRKNGMAPPLPTRKEKKALNRVSPKKKTADAEAKKAGSEDSLEKWFLYFMETSEPVCAECGMRADWLLEPQEDPKKAEAYRLIWRACQAHVLPKKKQYGFPSISTDRNNHIILFPSWGGHLCGCHGFYDSGWFNATTMKIWPQVQERFKILYPFIAEKERKNIPEQLQHLIN